MGSLWHFQNLAKGREWHEKEANDGLDGHASGRTEAAPWIN